ncbi:MAG: carbohydrate ABC transporter permease [Chloroflexi bacterium]|nr:carbohydrate ABC transporter permease [Chloroflexota bacterium]
MTRVGASPSMSIARPGAMRRFLLGTRFHPGALQQVILHLILIIIAGVMLLPMFWMVSTALRPDYLVFKIPPVWIPWPLVWSNFPASLQYEGQPVYLYAWNTVQISVLAVLGTVISSTIVAFGFARLDFPGRDALFTLVLSTLMLPFAVTMVPMFILFHALGWLDSFKPLIIPAWFGGGAFNIFLLRQFFLGIPREYDEAARIDGAGSWTILWRIIVPLSRPALATVTVFAFVYYWNDFLWPLVVISKQEHFTLSLFLATFQVAQRATPWNLLMAAATLVMLPTVLVFFVAQRLFIQGVALTGLKG